MQCNQSDGQRFAGNWEALPPTKFQLPVREAHAARTEPPLCAGYNPFGVIPLQQGECGYMGDCVY